MTTCPSGVHYQHLIDHARVHVEQHVSTAARGARVARRCSRRCCRIRGACARRWRWRRSRGRSRACCRRRCARCSSSRARDAARAAPSAPNGAPTALARRAASASRSSRAACKPCIAPEINAATIRLLERCGAEVVRGRRLLRRARASPRPRERARTRSAPRSSSGCMPSSTARGLDAIVANASGCGTHVKDYGYVFRDDARARGDAPRPLRAKARDVTEVLAELGLPPVVAGSRAAHRRLPLRVLDAARPEGRAAAARAARARPGSRCKEIAEGHLCCGSAGTYNVLQPEIADALARPQARAHRAHARRRRRDGQRRLHHAARGRRRRARRAHRRAARLGDGRPGAPRAQRRRKEAGVTERTRSQVIR